MTFGGSTIIWRRQKNYKEIHIWDFYPLGFYSSGLGHGKDITQSLKTSQKSVALQD